MQNENIKEEKFVENIDSWQSRFTLVLIPHICEAEEVTAFARR